MTFAEYPEEIGPSITTIPSSCRTKLTCHDPGIGVTSGAMSTGISQRRASVERQDLLMQT